MSRSAARLAALLLACGISVLSACGKPPSHEECNALLDHYVELLVSSDRPGTTATELHKLQIQARQKAVSDPEFGECSQRVSRRAYDCAMTAPSADKLEQCLL
jgi:hypothetical protein